MDDIATIHYKTYCNSKDDGITKNQLFTMIPTQSIAKWLNTQDSLITFYWNNKKPRIKQKWHT